MKNPPNISIFHVSLTNNNAKSFCFKFYCWVPTYQDFFGQILLILLG